MTRFVGRVRSLFKPALLAWATLTALAGLSTRRVAPMLCLVLGPFAGGVVRDFQECCVEFSWTVAPYAIAGLALGIAVVLLVPQTSPRRRTLRIAGATFAAFSWVAGAIISYGHALS